MLSTLAGAIDQSFLYLLKGADTKWVESNGQLPYLWRYNAASDNVATTTVVGLLVSSGVGIAPFWSVRSSVTAPDMSESR